MNKTITIAEIEDSLSSLDTEYRESLAHCLVDLNYISDTPLRLSTGTEQQNQELENAWERALKPNQIKKIMKYIDKNMKKDYQYYQFRNVYCKYMNIANEMNKKKIPRER